MATSYAPVCVSGGSHRAVRSSGSPFLGGKAPPPIVSVRPNRSSASRSLAVSARHGDGEQHDAGNFFTGFVLGGAIFGTLAYIYAPQMRRAILNENEQGFRLPRGGPIYHDDGLEITRFTLNEKMNQLTNAIDKAAQRLRGGNKKKVLAPDGVDVGPIPSLEDLRRAPEDGVC